MLLLARTACSSGPRLDLASASINNVAPAPASDVARWTGELEGLGYTSVECVLHLGTRRGLCSADRAGVLSRHEYECNGSAVSTPQRPVLACKQIR